MPKHSAGDCSRATTKPAMGSMNSPNAALVQFIGQEAGKRLAGNAPLNVDAAQVRTLGNEVPKGASIDVCADRITFKTATVSFVVEAVPPNNPDMTFRIAGLVNPTVVVPLGAKVTVEFINADKDQAHGWVITGTQPPFAFRQATPPALNGASAAVIGDPTAAGQGARMIAFVAGTKGTYHYLCPMPGHAQMGMAGILIVE
jgi:rusticyanin